MKSDLAKSLLFEIDDQIEAAFKKKDLAKVAALDERRRGIIEALIEDIPNAKQRATIEC